VKHFNGLAINRQLRIGIVEDEAIIAQSIFELLTDLGYEVCEPAGSYREALKLIKNQKPDLLILDIRLGDGPDGIALGRILTEQFDLPFIYLTANADRETVQAAKSTAPAAYLIKPFRKNDLYAAIEIASFKFNSGPDHKPDSSFVFLKDGNTLRKININEILFVESQHVYIKVYTKERNFLHRSSLQQFIQELKNPNFVQTHRSYLVNMNYVVEISQNQLKSDQFIIPVSRSFKQAVKEAFAKKV